MHVSWLINKSEFQYSLRLISTPVLHCNFRFITSTKQYKVAVITITYAFRFSVSRTAFLGGFKEK